MNEFRIVVVGAGETGTPLLKQLLTSPFVKVLGVADLDLAMPGIAMAREHGVEVSNDFMDFLRLGKEVDIVIDVTGAPKVREILRKSMVETGNDHTLIMHERIALLMMSLSAGKLVTGKHDSLEYN
jgi:predicted homoserine dehydrogenase-like protein